MYLPYGTFAATLTIWVVGSIAIPLGAFGIEKAKPLVPGVPPEAMKTEDDAARPSVVVISPPEVMEMGLFT